MASAQVLPSSRKQEHLEAGKRRLEEFRKKKAAERAKKAASSNQIHASDLSSNEKKLVDAEVVRLENSEAVGSTSIPDALLNQPSLTENRDDKLLQFSQGSRQNSISAIDSSSDFSVDQSDGFSRDTGQTFAEENKQHKSFGGSVSDGPLGYSYNQEDDDRRTDSGVYGSIFGLSSRKSSALSTQASQEIDRSSSHSSLHGREESLRKDNAGSLNDLLFAHPDTSFAANMGTQNSNSFLAHNKPPSGWRNSSSNEDSIQLTTNVMGSPEIGSRMLEAEHLNGSKTSDLPERKLTSTFSESPSMESTSSQGYSSAAFSSSSNHVPLYSTVSETHPRRSRPSFLDSLSVPRAPSSLPSKSTEPEESVWKNQSKLNSMGAVNSTHLHHANDETVGPVSKLRTFPHHSPEDSSYTSLFASNAASHADGQSMENMPGFYLPRQDDGFAALEQHIEDLTQEKFSLQRSLEASRALAESLAADNSSLTESYNQQRSLVNQLRADMEQLQREINARLVELEAVKHEYSNAQLECNAADERAKLLASEVIGLEEKALRLRSNELKLEKQLEKSQEEVSSYKKKVSSLEKDRQDLQSTISALQEEKKMLQSKLWKASVKGDLSKNNANKKDKSTLTDDLDVIPEMLIQQMQPDRTHVGTDSSISLSPSEDLQLNIEASSAYIPPEQMRMITNINALISELQLEKEELLKTLASEASENSKLKDLNKELSRKLEVQTQRLELLTAQNMVQDNVPAKLPDRHYVNENTAYADEGDEVVERVLGWIMKLFPGGPSRRRTSKLL